MKSGELEVSIAGFEDLIAIGAGGDAVAAWLVALRKHCAPTSFIMHCIGELMLPIPRCARSRCGASAWWRAMRTAFIALASSAFAIENDTALPMPPTTSSTALPCALSVGVPVGPAWLRDRAEHFAELGLRRLIEALPIESLWFSERPEPLAVWSGVS